MFCREQVAQLRDVAPEIDALGARLAVVGNGNARQAKEFALERELPFPLYADPGLRAYRAAELKRGVVSTLRPSLLANAARAFGGGHVQGMTQGDAWQQGGTFVVGPGGSPLGFAHVSQSAGDHPDLRDVVETLRTLARS